MVQPNVSLLFMIGYSWVIVIGCNNANPEDDEFNPRVVINRKFAAIKNVKPQSRQEADKTLKDEELVLAVEVNGKPRAYAINMLTGPAREIINDNLGDKSIAATW